MIWPRTYAAQILKIENREDRKAALKNVPRQYQALVRKHVEIVYQKRGVKKHGNDAEQKHSAIP